MTSINITKARAKLNQIVSEVNEFSQPITIINNRGKNAVLIGEEDWKAIQETLYLNSIPGMSQSILAMKEDIAETTNYDSDEEWQNIFRIPLQFPRYPVRAPDSQWSFRIALLFSDWVNFVMR